jgi:hypothetical protein
MTAFLLAVRTFESPISDRSLMDGTALMKMPGHPYASLTQLSY